MAEASDPSGTEPAPENAAAQRELEPLSVYGVAAAAVGIVMWLVLLVVLLIFRDQLRAHGAQWVMWVPVAGALLGIPGLWYVSRRRSAYLAAARDKQPGTSA